MPTPASVTPPRQPPLAIVVDTNCWEKGHFHRDKLKNLAARAARREIEIWIPGQVIVEWARHSADDASQSNTLLSRLFKAGLLPDKPGKAVEDATSIDADLRRSMDKIKNVRILEERGDSAVAAIRDQILGTGPGTVKNSVRTGAADSAIVRDVAAAAEGLEDVVFMTNNKRDFLDASRSLGYESVVIKAPGEIDAFLSQFVDPPTSSDATEQPEPVAVSSLLGAHFVSMESEASNVAYPDPPPLEPWIDISDLDLELGLLNELDVTTTTETRLASGLTVVGVWNVAALETTVEDERTVNRYEFKLALCGDVDVVGYDLDNDGSIVMQDDKLYDVLIVAPLIVDIVDNSVIGELEQTDVAEVSRPEYRFDEPEDGLAWLRDMLSATGVTGFPEEYNFVGKSLSLKGIHGRTVDMNVSATQDGGWEAVFDRGDKGFMTVGCAYDPNARAWLGRSDSFNLLPPFVITAEGVEASRAEHYLAVGEIWRHLLATS